MNKNTVAAITIVAVVLGAGTALAGTGGFWSSMMPSYGGMMNSGHGMMSAYGGMMDDSGCASYGAENNGATSDPITIEDARNAVDQYIDSLGNNDLELAEVMEFDNHFYASVKENSTGKHAFELLVDRASGAITPEMGPNMMWNTKYGHGGMMGSGGNCRCNRFPAQSLFPEPQNRMDGIIHPQTNKQHSKGN